MSFIFSEPPKCNVPMDVTFVLDSSGNVKEDEFEKEKAFVKSVANTLSIASYASHAALVSYNDVATVHAKLTDYTNFEEFLPAVDKIMHTPGGSRIDQALLLSNRSVFTTEAGMRNNIPRMLILLTAGRQEEESESPPLKAVVEPLKRKNTELTVVGIGKNVNSEQMLSLVEDHRDFHLVNTFSDLALLSRLISEDACDRVGK